MERCRWMAACVGGQMDKGQADRLYRNRTDSELTARTESSGRERDYGAGRQAWGRTDRQALLHLCVCGSACLQLSWPVPCPVLASPRYPQAGQGRTTAPVPPCRSGAASQELAALGGTSKTTPNPTPRLKRGWHCPESRYPPTPSHHRPVLPLTILFLRVGCLRCRLHPLSQHHRKPFPNPPAAGWVWTPKAALGPSSVSTSRGWWSRILAAGAFLPPLPPLPPELGPAQARHWHDAGADGAGLGRVSRAGLSPRPHGHSPPLLPFARPPHAQPGPTVTHADPR